MNEEIENNYLGILHTLSDAFPDVDFEIKKDEIIQSKDLSKEAKEELLNDSYSFQKKREKKCPICGQIKDIEHFATRKTSTNRRLKYSYCKTCVKIKASEYYKNNKEKRLEQIKQWRKDNSELIKEYAKRASERAKQRREQRKLKKQEQRCINLANPAILE